MGSVDLDPASCADANQVVGATQIYTKEENGLALPWQGCIWLNPPYGTERGKSRSGLWIKKLLAEYQAGHVEQAILLVNANTDTRWFQPLWRYLLCFTDGRVNFYSTRRAVRFHNAHGSVFVYLGKREALFAEHFCAFGTIVQQYESFR